MSYNQRNLQNPLHLASPDPLQEMVVCSPHGWANPNLYLYLFLCPLFDIPFRTSRKWVIRSSMSLRSLLDPVSPRQDFFFAIVPALSSKGWLQLKIPVVFTTKTGGSGPANF